MGCKRETMRERPENLRKPAGASRCAPPMKPISERTDLDPATFREAVVGDYRPIVLRGIAADWPAVRAGRGSPRSARDYLLGFDRGAAADAFVGAPEIGGRFFYTPALDGLNFARRKASLRALLDALVDLCDDPDPPALYAGALETERCLPGFAEANRLALLAGLPTMPRIWIGNTTTISTHVDSSDNVAVVVAGRRRFTLFPPDQLANLYVGPLDFTPAGQPVSMVDIADPDLARYPRFADALAVAETAELEPGDAIYIPALWWHQVDALSRFNLLVNHWWDDSPEAGMRFVAMIHAILGLSALAPRRREAWGRMFDHFALQRGGDPAAHLEPARRGVLAAMTPELSRRIRGFLLANLQRP